MATVQGSQNRLRVVGQYTTETIFVASQRHRTPANFPTDFIQASKYQLRAVTQPVRPIDMSGARLRVVARGRVANPRVRAWTFTLDGHDFYILRLGDAETLVYDTYSEQWTTWRTTGLPMWRVNTGINWEGAVSYAVLAGSNVLVGDDVTGRLYFLAPEKQSDDFPAEPAEGEQGYGPIERTVMGQIVMRRRDVMPCHEVYITGDMESPFENAMVTLSTSDDAGKNFYSHGSYVLSDAPDKEFVWRSLGQIEAPGRLFRIDDTGMFTRIDGLEMNDPEQQNG